MIVNKMMSNFNVLCPKMLDQNFSQIDYTSIITINMNMV
jgi:hypothetical protein